MDFGDWMIVEMTPEQQFDIEKKARALLDSEDAGKWRLSSISKPATSSSYSSRPSMRSPGWNAS